VGSFPHKIRMAAEGGKTPGAHVREAKDAHQVVGGQIVARHNREAPNLRERDDQPKSAGPRINRGGYQRYS